MSISTEEKDRYLRETAIVLAREGFQTGKTDTGKLRVLLDGAPLCEVTENGGITYRNEDIITSSPWAEQKAMIRRTAFWNRVLRILSESS